MAYRTKKIRVPCRSAAVAIVFVAMGVCMVGFSGGCSQSGGVQAVIDGTASVADASAGAEVERRGCAVVIMAPFATEAMTVIVRTKKYVRRMEYVGNLPVIPGVVWGRGEWPDLIPSTCDSGLCKWIVRGNRDDCAYMRTWPQYVKDIDVPKVEELDVGTGLGGW